MIWVLGFIFLGLVAFALFLLTIIITNERAWERGELCPLCERPWAECPGCRPTYLRTTPMPTTCTCTDGGRSQPLKDCPHCGGTGELK